jgi:hypothetical protein
MDDLQQIIFGGQISPTDYIWWTNISNRSYLVIISYASPIQGYMFFGELVESLQLSFHFDQPKLDLIKITSQQTQRPAFSA